MPNVILISIHVNAAGDGTKWMNATGWSCYTCKGQTESDRLADCLYKAAEQILKNQVIRTDYARGGDPDWEENFYILRHSLCPAVLTENFFMDFLQDRSILLSKTGKDGVIDTHVQGILYYISFSFYNYSLLLANVTDYHSILAILTDICQKSVLNFCPHNP